MKEHYPCPVCFTSGRVRTGIIERGKEGHMWLVTEKVRKIYSYKCVCGSLLLVNKEDEK